MKRAMLLAASALVLTAFVPEQADAQGRRFGVGPGVVRGPVIVGRGPVYSYPRGYYGYRRGYRPGVGAAVGLGILGGAPWALPRLPPTTVTAATPACASSRSLMPMAMPAGPTFACAEGG